MGELAQSALWEQLEQCVAAGRAFPTSALARVVCAPYPSTLGFLDCVRRQIKFCPVLPFFRKTFILKVSNKCLLLTQPPSARGKAPGGVFPPCVSLCASLPLAAVGFSDPCCYLCQGAGFARISPRLSVQILGIYLHLVQSHSPSRALWSVE